MAELDDVMFGVSTRLQWNALITQLQASTISSKSGKSSKKREKRKGEIIKMIEDETRDQNKKGGKGQVSECKIFDDVLR